LPEQVEAERPNVEQEVAHVTGVDAATRPLARRGGAVLLSSIAIAELVWLALIGYVIYWLFA
jgi:hypothetical protein